MRTGGYCIPLERGRHHELASFGIFEIGQPSQKLLMYSCFAHLHTETGPRRVKVTAEKRVSRLQKLKIYNCLKIACHKIQDRAYETVKMCMVRTLHGKLLG